MNENAFYSENHLKTTLNFLFLNNSSGIKRAALRIARGRQTALGQIGGCHLTALAGDLEQPVLMNLMLDTGRQVKRLPSFEAVDMLAHDDEDLLRYLSPLGWKHINLTGDYLWRSSAKITGGRFKPLWPMAGA